MSIRAFIYRFWSRIRNWLVRFVPTSDGVQTSDRESSSGSAPVFGCNPVSESLSEAGASPSESASLRRILLLTSGLKPYRRRMPSVRCLTVSGFPEAYRFLLRLGGCNGLSVYRAGGSLRYRTVLPDASGRLELVDRTPVSDRRIIAVLYLDLPGSGCPVTEIRFLVCPSEKNGIR